MKIDYSLYVCTDRTLMTSRTIEESVEKAISGGAGVISITHKHGVPLIINDRVDIALACDADGVHVGQEDIPARVCRALIGKDKILGVSCSTLEEAIKAEEDGADYIGLGAVIATDTKSDAPSVRFEDIVKIRESVHIPIVIIGGLNMDTISRFKGLGIDGIAVVSAVVAKEDVEKSARELKKAWLA